MSYFRASTGNDQGWRPGTVTLGNEIRHAGPDWKTVAAQHAAAARAGKQIHAARQRNTRHRMNAIDAAARGDRTRVRMPRLSGLGALSTAASMMAGAQYTFHFSINSSFWGGNISPNSLSSTIAADGNFGGVSVAQESGGFQVNFTYRGQGSSIAGASNEMQGIINNAFFNGLGLTGSAVFVYAEGGPLLTTDASGNAVVVTDVSGNVVSAGTTSPGGTLMAPATGSSTFDLTSLLSGLGIGGVAALLAGVVLVMKS